MSTVLKQGQNGKLLRRTLSFDLADHLAEAHNIVVAAKKEAAETIDQARRAAQRLQVQARQVGYQEGHAAGLKQGQRDGHAEALAGASQQFAREHAELVESLRSIATAFDSQKQDLLLAARVDVLDLAVRLAERVAKGLGEFDRDTVIANVERALRMVAVKTDLSIRIHPSDAETMRRFTAQLHEGIAGSSSISIVEDEKVAAGGAVVRAGEMEVDARIDTQLQQIAGLLLGRNEK